MYIKKRTRRHSDVSGAARRTAAADAPMMSCTSTSAYSLTTSQDFSEAPMLSCGPPTCSSFTAGQNVCDASLATLTSQRWMGGGVGDSCLYSCDSTTFTSMLPTNSTAQNTDFASLNKSQGNKARIRGEEEEDLSIEETFSRDTDTDTSIVTAIVSSFASNYAERGLRDGIAFTTTPWGEDAGRKLNNETRPHRETAAEDDHGVNIFQTSGSDEGSALVTAQSLKDQQAQYALTRTPSADKQSKDIASDKYDASVVNNIGNNNNDSDNEVHPWMDSDRDAIPARDPWVSVEPIRDPYNPPVSAEETPWIVPETMVERTVYRPPRIINVQIPANEKTLRIKVHGVGDAAVVEGRGDGQPKEDDAPAPVEDLLPCDQIPERVHPTVEPFLTWLCNTINSKWRILLPLLAFLVLFALIILYSLSTSLLTRSSPETFPFSVIHEDKCDNEQGADLACETAGIEDTVADVPEKTGSIGLGDFLKYSGDGQSGATAESSRSSSAPDSEYESNTECDEGDDCHRNPIIAVAVDYLYSFLFAETPLRPRPFADYLKVQQKREDGRDPEIVGLANKLNSIRKCGLQGVFLDKDCTMVEPND